jgi:hypothetical protein
LGQAGLALALLIGLQRLIEAALLRVGSRPIGLAWTWVSRLGSVLPQPELWAGLIGLFAWLALRSLGNRPRPSTSVERHGSEPSGTLTGWLELLSDQRRGAYFRWRVARRAAQLADELDAAPPIDQPQLGSFLEAGRQLRTIRTAWADGGLRIDPQVIADYLERAIERSDS